FTELRCANATVVTTLERLLLRPEAKQRFRFILNRSCYILINHWQNQSQHRWAIRPLVDILAAPMPLRGGDRGKTVGTLRRLFQAFQETDLYLRLCQTVALLEATDEPAEDQPLAALLRRYPYLYEAQLTGADDRQQFQEQLAIVQHLQTQVQQQFEHDLGRYVTYEYRRSLGAAKNLEPVKNPTMLSNQELFVAFKLFGGKVDNGMTYEERAAQFLRDNPEGQNYRLYKQNLANYLINAIPASRDRDVFAQKLQKFMDELFPQFDRQGLNDFLVTRTCSRLLNFLVIENQKDANHKTFIDLICQLGPTKMVGLLLKIVLICKKVKGYLERLICTLFNYYAEKAQGEVRWLIKVLENIKLAFSLHFGMVDLRFIRQLFA
ncbi:MAG: hypothetical protein Q6J18_02440, partial [Gloeomargarita sp. DG02_3_bins_56]